MIFLIDIVDSEHQVIVYKSINDLTKRVEWQDVFEGKSIIIDENGTEYEWDSSKKDEIGTVYDYTLIPTSRISELITECLQTAAEKRPTTADEIELRLLKIMQGTHITKSFRAEAEKVMANIKDKFSLLDIIKHTDYGTVYLFEDRSTHNLLVIKKRINTEAGYLQAQKLKCRP